MGLSQKLRRFFLARRGADGLVQVAEGFRRAGQGTYARHYCDLALKKSPGHTAALHLGGVIALEEGRIQDAVHLLQSSQHSGNRDLQLHYDLGEAYRLADDWAKAVPCFERALEENPEVLAARIGLGECLLHLGKTTEARHHLDRALATAPQDARLLMLCAQLALAEGDLPRAERQLRLLLAVRPDDQDALRELAKTLVFLDRLDETESVLRSLQLDSHIDVQGVLVKLIATRVKNGQSPVISRPPAPGAVGVLNAPAREAAASMISIIICSVNEKKFQAVCANYAERLAGERYEIIGIHDARSLCEGYNRGVRRAAGDILVFSHDDIEILTPDFAPRLRRHLQVHDLVGPCGTSQLIMGQWMAAGWPHVHGLVAHHFPPDHEQGNLFRVLVMDASADDSTGCLQALDGMFMATTREVAESCPFDEKTFDNFHLYDLDFSFSAYLAGYDVAVFRDITMVHYTYADSPGYEEAFLRNRERFEAKYRQDLSRVVQDPRRFIPAMFDTKEEVAAFCRQLMSFRQQHGAAAGDGRVGQ